MAEALVPGATFAGAFLIEAIAGRGGMGVVYRARQIALDRTVALKVISPLVADVPDFRARFAQEARLAAAIEHPNVVAVYHAGEHDARPYLVMQWIDGSDLRDLVASDGPLAPERAIDLIGQVGSALDAAHARGLLHRDVKPSNVLVRETDAGERAYLTDFGVAKALAEVSTGAGLTQPGQVVGTSGYLAPELIKGEHGDGRADLYALGCVLYEVLTGDPPFKRESDMAVMFAHTTGERPRPSAVRPELAPLDPVVARALAIDPDARFARAAELRRELEHAWGSGAEPRHAGGSGAAPRGAGRSEAPTPLMGLAAPPPGAPPPPSAPRSRPTRARIKALVAGLALLAAAVAVAAVLVLSGDDEKPSDRAQTPTPTASASTATPAPDADKLAVVQVLEGYESGYTDQDLTALGDVFASDVVRRGRDGAKCVTTEGRDAVVSTYASQFTAGTGAYDLIDLDEQIVELDGDGATATSRYTIAPASAGSVSFHLHRGDDDQWLIDRVVANC